MRNDSLYSDPVIKFAIGYAASYQLLRMKDQIQPDVRQTAVRYRTAITPSFEFGWPGHVTFIALVSECL